MYVRSSRNTNRNRRVYAEEEVQTGAVDVQDEATELVFETEDVAELIAEVTGEDVEVVADEEAVTFTVGDTDYTVESEGQEEILESTRKNMRGKRTIRANSRNTSARRPVSAATRKTGSRTVRRVSR